MPYHPAALGRPSRTAGPGGAGGAGGDARGGSPAYWARGRVPTAVLGRADRAGRPQRARAGRGRPPAEQHLGHAERCRTADGGAEHGRARPGATAVAIASVSSSGAWRHVCPGELGCRRATRPPPPRVELHVRPMTWLMVPCSHPGRRGTIPIMLVLLIVAGLAVIGCVAVCWGTAAPAVFPPDEPTLDLGADRLTAADAGWWLPISLVGYQTNPSTTLRYRCRAGKTADALLERRVADPLAERRATGHWSSAPGGAAAGRGARGGALSDDRADAEESWRPLRLGHVGTDYPPTTTRSGVAGPRRRPRSSGSP